MITLGGMRLSCQTLPGLQGLALGVLTLPGGGVSSLGLLIFNILKIYLFMTVLGFHCCTVFSLVATSRGLLSGCCV